MDLEKHQDEMACANRLYVLKKHRAHYTIEFIEDPDDSWFVYVTKVKNKTKKHESFNMIIKKDMETFLESYTSLGWKIETK